MLRLNQRGVRETVRPSGHHINSSFVSIDAGGSIPSNVVEPDDAETMLKFGNNASNDEFTKRCKELGIKIHPARFPTNLPEFFIKFLTDEDDLVLDPFAGSNTAGVVSEQLARRWIAMDLSSEYLEASKVRFPQAKD